MQKSEIQTSTNTIVLGFTQAQVDHMKRIYQTNEDIFLGDLDLYLHLSSEASEAQQAVKDQLNEGQYYE